MATSEINPEEACAPSEAAAPPESGPVRRGGVGALAAAEADEEGETGMEDGEADVGTGFPGDSSDNFESFMAHGDAHASAPTSASAFAFARPASPVVPMRGAAEPASDAADIQMLPAPQLPPSTPPSSPPSRAAAAPMAPPPQGGPSFLSGLFGKVASTIGDARREIDRADVMGNAQALLEGGVARLPRVGGDGSARRWASGEDDARDLGPQGRRMEGLRGLAGNLPAVKSAGMIGRGSLGVVSGGKVCSIGIGRTGVVVEGVVDVLGAPERGGGVKSAALLSGVEVVLCFDDGVVSVFSLSDGALLRSTVLPQDGGREHGASVCCHAPGRIVVGGSRGRLFLLDAADLSVAQAFAVSDLVVVGVGAERPVTCVSASASGGDGNCVVLAGYADGTASAYTGGGEVGVSFAAHCGPVMACISIAGGVLTVSVGGELDPSICVTQTVHGKCMCRRPLSYPASTLTEFGSFPGRESILAVGGVEGQVDLFSVVVLTKCAVEIRLICRVSAKINRNARVASIVFDASSDIVIVVAANGGVRRWRLGLAEAETMPHRLALSPAMTNDALRAVAIDGQVGGISTTRLAASDRVVNAQRILASILQDDSVGVSSEAVKDELVNRFSQTQTRMSEQAGQFDRELQRARKRILRGRFGSPEADESLTPVEAVLFGYSRTTAAAELHGAGERHKKRVDKILEQSVVKFQQALKFGLANASGSNDEIWRLEEAINAL